MIICIHDKNAVELIIDRAGLQNRRIIRRCDVWIRKIGYNISIDDITLKKVGYSL